MTEQPKIAILLSTYNGESFLEEQLDSLFQQSYSNFIIVARDDGSSDSSPTQLANYSKNYPAKFHLLEDGAANLGASASFSSLIQYVLKNKQELNLEAAYMMFCDQDDIWLQHKIAKEMELMLAMEFASDLPSQNTEKVPVLVHSDLRVVSADKELIADSFIRFQGLDVNRNSFGQLLASNLITGCTALINESLARAACPIPVEAIMHDWWLGLVAAAQGKLGFISEPLIDYRQHDANTIGAKEHKSLLLQKRGLAKKLFNSPPLPLLIDVSRQASSFQQRYQASLTPGQKAVLGIARACNTKSSLLQRLLFRILRGLHRARVEY